MTGRPSNRSGYIPPRPPDPALVVRLATLVERAKDDATAIDDLQHMLKTALHGGPNWRHHVMLERAIAAAIRYRETNGTSLGV